MAAAGAASTASAASLAQAASLVDPSSACAHTALLAWRSLAMAPLRDVACAATRCSVCSHCWRCCAAAAVAAALWRGRLVRTQRAAFFREMIASIDYRPFVPPLSKDYLQERRPS